MRKTVLIIIIAFLVFSSWVVWERHEITSCFNTPSCVLNNAGATEGIILMQYQEDEWRLAVYQNGNLTLHILKLKGNIIPEVEHHVRSVKTYADYSPLSFEAKSVENLERVKAGLIVKSNGTVRVFKGNSLEELMQNSVPCQRFITICPKCRVTLGESWELVRLGHTNVTGGYLVFPSEDKCLLAFILKIMQYNSTHDILEIEYPIGIVGGYIPKLDLPQIGNTSLPANVSRYFESAWGILVTKNETVLNPDPWSIAEELGECRTVYKITIHNNGTIEKTEYGLPCWRK
ncbi:hypothetical protein [Thermococcus camini]|uniref:Uncharacterized protein n=1 Tax=Thermococcus camini TaxID=2016373 RepID=A0A7G2D5E7_9EURY|nr:hypothetical protein [Thermococcus camini]CAD5243520.1 conserved protein of unknown function [Thermococcus camini]